MEEKDTQTKSTPVEQTSLPQPGNHRPPFILPVVLGLLVAIFGGLLIGSVGRWHHPETIVSGRSMMSRDWDDNQFGGKEAAGGPMMGFGGMRAGHQQILGAVTKIDGDSLTIVQHDTDITIKITSDTSIYKNREIAKKTDIKVGSVIIVRGAPGSDGSITARSIIIN